MSTENPTDTNPALDSIIDSIAGNPAPSEDVAPAEPQATEVAAEQPAAKSNKSECCNDKPAKSEKHGCGC